MAQADTQDHLYDKMNAEDRALVNAERARGEEFKGYPVCGALLEWRGSGERPDVCWMAKRHSGPHS